MTQILRLLSCCFFVALANTFPAKATALNFGEQIQLGDSHLQVMEKLKSYCKKLSQLDVSPPNYPLAEKTEQHIICINYADDKMQLNSAAFVLADDKLTQVNAEPANIDEIEQLLGEAEGEYLDNKIFLQGAYWLDKNNNRVTWLSKAALHPNLFSWTNPYLTSTTAVSYSHDIRIPTMLDFSRNLETLMPLFQNTCPLIKVDKANRIWLPNKPTTQTQVNCFAYPYVGFPRKLEAVFGDGKLEVIWVLTGKQEEERLRQLLQAEYGPAESVSDNWEIFAKGRISLRKDKPELLILSDEMIPLYKAKLAQ